MKIINGNKNIDIQIDSYEFPYDEKAQAYDNNWINVKVIWEDDVMCQEGIVPCLTAMEWEGLIHDLKDLTIKKTEVYSSSFMEPNLCIQMKPYENGYALYISFLMKNHNEPFVFVKQIDKEELGSFIEDLEVQFQQFPIR